MGPISKKWALKSQFCEICQYDWEVDLVVKLLGTLQSERVLIGWDTVSWKGAGNGIYSENEAYRLHPGPVAHFPVKGIWVPNASSKSTFYAWEATGGKVLTLDKLQKRGLQLPTSATFVIK